MPLPALNPDAHFGVPTSMDYISNRFPWSGVLALFFVLIGSSSTRNLFIANLSDDRL